MEIQLAIGRELISDLNLVQYKANVDNQSATAITKNLVYHGRTKQLKIKYHFVSEMQQEKEVIKFTAGLLIFSLSHCQRSNSKC